VELLLDDVKMTHCSVVTLDRYVKSVGTMVAKKIGRCGMKTVQFMYRHTANVTGTSAGHYYESDHRYASGTYVPLADYERLLLALEKCSQEGHAETCSRVLDQQHCECDCHITIARSALEGE
jgi:hypothetical protein